MSLFRREATSHQSERLPSAITLTHALSIKLTILILLFVIATFLFNSEYSPKEVVRSFFISPHKIQLSVSLQESTHRLQTKLKKQQMKAFDKAFNLSVLRDRYYLKKVT